MTTVEPKKKLVEAEKEPAQVKEEKKEIPVDFFYPENHLETFLPESSIPNNCFNFQF